MRRFSQLGLKVLLCLFPLPYSLLPIPHQISDRAYNHLWHASDFPAKIQHLKSQIAQSQYNLDDLEVVEQRLRTNPKDADAYQKRGMIRAYSEDFANAVEDYDRSLQLDPNNAQTYNYRGTAYFWLKNYQKALEDYDRAIRLNPQFALAHYNRGYVRQALGDKQGAIADFQTGADLSREQGDLSTYQEAVELLKKLSPSP
jgi:tetratricopeptide (TPR) repeat protein